MLSILEQIVAVGLKLASSGSDIGAIKDAVLLAVEAYQSNDQAKLDEINANLTATNDALPRD